MRTLKSPEIGYRDGEFHSPEQPRGGFPGPAAEVYSIGAVLFETATGKISFRAHDHGETEDEEKLERDEQLERRAESVRVYRHVRPSSQRPWTRAWNRTPHAARRCTIS